MLLWTLPPLLVKYSFNLTKTFTGIRNHEEWIKNVLKVVLLLFRSHDKRFVKNETEKSFKRLSDKVLNIILY